MATPDPVPTAAPVADPPPADPAPAAPSALPADPAPADPPATPTAVPTPDESPLGLTGDMAADQRLAKFQTVDALAQSYLQIESSASNSIRVPGPEATPEDREAYLTKLQKHAPELMVKPDKDHMDEFYKTLGRPDKAEQYAMPEMKTPDDEPVDLSDMDGFREVAYNAGLTETQFQQVVTETTKANIANSQASMGEWGKEIQALRAEWGNAYGDRYRAASDIAIRTGAPAEVTDLMRSGYISPDTIRWLYNLSKQFGSEGGQLAIQDGGGQTQTGLSPDEARAQLSEMMNNKQHALWLPHHPDHQVAVLRRLELQKAISPDASTNVNELRAGPGH